MPILDNSGILLKNSSDEGQTTIGFQRPLILLMILNRKHIGGSAELVAYFNWMSSLPPYVAIC